jgi:mannose-6-phosphate isomerase-like protein (cupin superfamily)
MKTALALLFALVVVDQARAQTAQATPAADALPVSDQQLRMVSIKGEYNVGAAVVHRAKTAGQEPGGALAHSQITEVYYIISGNGTLVTGGTLENAKDRPTTGRTVIGPSTEGTKIINGKSRQVGPGDMVIIPPDTPHTFTEITTDRIVYMVVRVDPHKILQAD